MATSKQLRAARANLEKAHQAQQAAAGHRLAAQVPRQGRAQAQSRTSAPARGTQPQATAPQATAGRQAAPARRTRPAASSAPVSSNMTRAELYEIAKKQHLAGRAGMSRAQLASALSIS